MVAQRFQFESRDTTAWVELGPAHCTRNSRHQEQQNKSESSLGERVCVVLPTISLGQQSSEIATE